MLSIDTVKKLANFLIENNKPLNFDYTKKYHIRSNSFSVEDTSINYGKKKVIQTATEQTIFNCNKCKSQNLKVTYGRNYYFKCLDCGNNIPIKHTCKTSECKPRTKKRKNQFFKVCEKCGIDELFYENKQGCCALTTPKLQML